MRGLAFSTSRALCVLDLLEEIVTFIVYQHECREVFDFNFPDSFHTQFRIGHALEALNTGLRQRAAGPPMLPR